MDGFLIPDEWLEDIKGIAARAADGHNVTFSRKALQGVLARLDEAEGRGRVLDELKPVLGELRATLTLAVNQLPLPDGPLLEQFRNIHDRMRQALTKLELFGVQAAEEITCPCGLRVLERSRWPGGSHYGHTGPKNG